MSEIYWLNPISGSFTNPVNWSGDVVPGASDDAIINAVGERHFTVTASESASVNSIQTASGATLAITGGVFTLAEGTGSGVNAGVILLARHSTLAASGEITNTGSIQIDSGSLLFAGYATLTGGGQLDLGANGNDSIGHLHHSRSTELDNINNTISGSGSIEKSSKFFFTNDVNGVIDANADMPLLVYGNAINHGLVESTGSGGLTFETTNPSNGVFLAANGSKMQIIGPQLDGATLVSKGSGVITCENIFSYQLTNEAKLVFEEYNKIFQFKQNFENIDNLASVYVESGSVEFYDGCTLFGGGTINIKSGSDVSVGGRNGGTFTNVDNTIAGYGDIFGALYVKSYFINEQKGVIDGVGPSDLFVGFGELTVANAGTIESTGGNGVNLWSSLRNSGLVIASAGTIAVGRPGETYNLTNSGTFEAIGGGGVVIESAIANTGVFSVQAGGVLTADQAVTGSGVAMVNVGTLDFASSFNQAVTFTGAGTLELAQSQGFTNSVKGFSNDGATTLDLDDIAFVGAGEATFSGTMSGGVLTVTDGTNTAKITLKGNYLGSTFVASSDGPGGTDVVAQNIDGLGAPVHAFISAMAAFGLPAAQAIHACASLPGRELLLTSPRAAIA